jgi:hypothetical protein
MTVVQRRDDPDTLMLQVGVQLARAIALQHVTAQSKSATDLDLGELTRLVNEITAAIDLAKTTTTHTNTARKSLEKIDAVYGELTARARNACEELTKRLRGA